MKLRKHCHNLKKSDDNVFCLETEPWNEWYKDIKISPNHNFNIVSLSLLPKSIEACHLRKLLIYAHNS